MVWTCPPGTCWHCTVIMGVVATEWFWWILRRLSMPFQRYCCKWCFHRVFNQRKAGFPDTRLQVTSTGKRAQSNLGASGLSVSSGFPLDISDSCLRISFFTNQSSNFCMKNMARLNSAVTMSATCTILCLIFSIISPMTSENGDLSRSFTEVLWFSRLTF